MSHRIGSVVPETPAFVVGPGSGLPPTSPGVWERTFSPPPHAGGTKFLMLHFTAVSLGLADRLEVVRGADPDPFDAMDVFTAADGTDFWSRPVEGNSVVVRFIDGGDGTGLAAIAEYGRGEGIRNDGNSDGGGNANGDVFMLDAAWAEPTFFNAAGVCPAATPPSWEHVAQLPAGVMRDTARAVGMFIVVEADHLSTCSATLIAPDLILTAGHCVSTDHHARTGSFTLDFQTDAAGTRPAGYNPRFCKLRRVVSTGMARAPGDPRPVRDYAIVQIDTPTAGVGVPPVPMRTTLPSVGDEVFVIHHPRGVVKKVSRRPADAATVQSISSQTYGTVLHHSCDIDNGSSGSSLFDATGRIVALNNWAYGACNGQSLSIVEIQEDFGGGVPPPTDVDVMVVFDRSGSMSLPSHTAGMTKLEHARRAVALFVDLIRKDATHRVGLVTFSSSAASPAGFAGLHAANDATETTLTGPPPHSTGIVGGLTAGGNTTIGGGLQLARAQFPAPGAAANTPALLLLTDGLQNTPPMIADVESSLAGTQVCVLGFGTEASLDGPLLTGLARRHRGIYTRAEDGLALRKFFVLCFGNIFESGVSLDPLYEFPAGATEAAPIALRVCGESRLTVVVGWEHPEAWLQLGLTTPGGAVINAATPGIVDSYGDTWAYLRLPLPFNGERDGTWQINVSRQAGIELGEALPAARFFVTSVIDGGPYLRPVRATRRYYTGDTLNPLTELRDPSGEHVDATVTLEVQTPADGTGNILTTAGLRPSVEVGGDTLGARASTLIALEQERGAPIVSFATRTLELFDDGEHGDGAMEPDGIFGNPITDLTRHEGDYTFRAVAEFGNGCTAARETFWSLHVGIGIDPQQTEVDTTVIGTEADGRQRVRLEFTPRDTFGNHLGPGRLADLDLTPAAGSQSSGALTDIGDGSYQQEVFWDPASSTPPGVIITQPGRPPALVSGRSPAHKLGCLVWVVAALLVVVVVLVILLVL